MASATSPATQASEGDDLPPTLRLWFCVGCNSMGNFGGCADGCSMEPAVVVSAEEYADLLSHREALRELAAELASVLGRLRAPPPAESDAEQVWMDIAGAARRALAATKSWADCASRRSREEADYFEIERCEVCGAAEAPQPCIGVCIRKVGDFVLREAYDALAVEVESLTSRCESANALLRRISGVVPREGQWYTNIQHFQGEAEHLPSAAQATGQTAAANDVRRRR